MKNRSNIHKIAEICHYSILSFIVIHGGLFREGGLFKAQGFIGLVLFWFYIAPILISVMTRKIKV